MTPGTAKRLREAGVEQPRCDRQDCTPTFGQSCDECSETAYTLEGLLAEGNERGCLWEMGQNNDGNFWARLYEVGRYGFTRGSGNDKDPLEAVALALLEIVKGEL